MNVTYYGNACFSIFHNGIHILCDPWLDGPAVAGGWTHFPPCKTGTKDIPKPDYIYISHIHSDHCETETLKNLDKDIPVISIAREPNFVSRMLNQAGFENLIMVPEKQSTEIVPGFSVETYGGTYEHIAADLIDSSILFDFGNLVVLNCNDNMPEEDFCRYIAEKYPSVDLAFLPSGGGGGYPAMYTNLNHTEKQKIIDDALEIFAQKFTKAVDIIKPDVVVPVAGGYAIQGPLAETVNWLQFRRFNLMEIAEYYSANGTTKAQVAPLQNEMVLNVESKSIEKGQYHIWSHDELAEHFKKLSKSPIKYAVSTTKKLPTLPRLIGRARANMWARQEIIKMKVDYTVYLEVEGIPELTSIKLNSSETSQIQPDAPLNEPYLKLKLDQDTVLEWLLGFEDFNMLDSGHRILFDRAPNKYVQEAYFLLSYLRL